ncbi:hypothetical protein V8F20_003085 [Naviculisporaceae sp. PSN 640]
MDATADQPAVDPRLRGSELSASDKSAHHGGAKASASTPAGASASASPSSRATASPVQGHQSQPQQLLNRRQYQAVAPSPTQSHLHSHSHAQQQQSPSQSQPQISHLQAQQAQAQAQAQARASAQASAHQHAPPPPTHHHSNQHGGPVSEFSPADSASLTPSTPVGGGSGYPGHNDIPSTVDSAHNDPNADPKKPRACESCRGLKVRCEPDPANPDGPCKRCAKANRACVVTQPTRKRQKKTDNRVAELEKKIDALTASLQATRGGAPGSVSPSPAIAPSPLPHPGTTTSPSLSRGHHPIAPSASSVRGSSHNRSESDVALGRYAPTPSAQQSSRPLERDWGQAPNPQRSSSSYTPGGGSIDHDSHSYHHSTVLPPITSTTAGQKRKYTESRDISLPELRDSSSTPQPRALNSTSDQPDIVDRGLLTMLQACEFYARYTEQMAPHLPGVVFPSNMTAAELRRTKPTLFLAIMSVASSNFPQLQRNLTNELMQVFADRVIVTGSKSLELIQALQVAVIWYYPPEHFEEIKFYQLLHIAAVMAIDLGLGNKKQFKGGFRKHLPVHWRDHPLRKRPMEDPTTLEARRAWLTCYFLATNSSMALHRPNLIRWTPFMAECVDVLESSPDAAPTDKYLCQLIWAHRLAEEVGVQFSMDDPASAPNIAEPRTQYALKGFERELERHVSSVPRDLMQPSLRMTFHVLNLYMHEIATQSDFSEDLSNGGRPGSEGDGREKEKENSVSSLLGSDAPLTAAHINAMSACLSAVDGIFETFLSLDVSSIRCLPVFNFVRVAYAVVVLMKIYFAASSPRSELGKVINKDNMKVEMHLEALVDKFGASAADDRSRPAAKFLVVLVMLRTWFRKQKGLSQGEGVGNGDGARAAEGGPGSSGTGNNTPRLDGGMSRESEGMGMPERGHGSRQQDDYASTANTPLQLLSEVATANNNSSSRPSSTRPTGSNISDLLSASASANTTMGSSTPSLDPRRAPWTGRPSAFVFDPAGAAEAAATLAAAQTNSNANAPEATNSGNNAVNTSGAGGSNLSWLENAAMFTPDFTEYANMADGFAHAMDLTLGGLTSTDGTFGGMMMGLMGYGLEGMSGMSTGMGPGGAGQGQSQAQSRGYGQHQHQQQHQHQGGPNPNPWYMQSAPAAALDGMGGGYGF